MMDRPDLEDRSIGFTLACAVILAGVIAACVLIASREWFFGDDFVFLVITERLDSWLEVFLPLGPRRWWSYRPLTIEVYFHTLRAIAGFHPLPYLLHTLALHFAAGAVVYRLARQLEIGPATSLWTASLSVCMAPSMGSIFWASSFQTVGGKFLYLLTVSLHLRWLSDGGGRWRLASALAMFLAFLSSETAMTLAGTLLLFSFWRSDGRMIARVTSTLRRTWPQISLLAIYLVFRWVLIGPPQLPMPQLYNPILGMHAFSHVASYALFLWGDNLALCVGAFGILGLIWIALLRREEEWHWRSWALARTVVLLGWLAAVMVPFIFMPITHPRMAIIMEAPLCLLIGVHVHAFHASGWHGSERVFRSILVGWLLLALPYSTLLERFTNPRGEVGRQLAAALPDHEIPLRPGSCVQVLPDPDEAWTSLEVLLIRWNTRGILAALYPRQRLRLEIMDPSLAGSPHCLRLALRHGPQLEWAD